jgi:hypothetical protein
MRRAQMCLGRLIRSADGRRARTPAALLLLLAVGLLVGSCAPATASDHAARAIRATATVTASAPSSPLEAKLAAQVRQAIGSLGTSVEATYDATKATATITVTVSGNVPMTDANIAAAHNLVELICYWALPAVWSSGAPLHEVTAIVVGPIQNEYADIITDWYGVAVVKADTAQHIHWPSLSPYSAWNLYDQHILRSSFDVFD